MHAVDGESANPVEELRLEQAEYAGIRPSGSGGESAVDPETVARRYLNQALASAAVPSLTAPESNGTLSKFSTIGTETVPLTATHTVKFRQTLHDIPIYGSLVTVEIDNDNSLVGIDSALGEPGEVDPVADVSPAQALEVAAAAPSGYRPDLTGIVPRLHYFFDSTTSSWRLVYILEDVPVSVDRGADSATAQEGTFEAPHIMDFVVDAHDRSVVALLPRTPSMAAVGPQTGVDSFGVSRTFEVTQEDDHLVLIDPSHNVHTFDYGFGDPTMPGKPLPGDAIVNPPAWTPAAVSAHANAVAVSEFLRTVLMRDNIDDHGGAMVSTISCVVISRSPGPQEWHNAFWSSQIQQMVYGQVRRGTELRSLAANVDVVAHEMFHGVTDHTSRLEYRSQSGALNESYSDIFGTIVANLGNDDPRTWDWLLGQNLLANDKPFRDVSNPPLFDQPDHMDNFVVLAETEDDDWGGVHVNSGIHNKAAYNMLVAAGDDGALTLTPTEVAAVFYLALTQRLSRTSQFIDSRNAVVASARTLFRNLPADELDRKIAAVEGAFDSVGIA